MAVPKGCCLASPALLALLCCLGSAIVSVHGLTFTEMLDRSLAGSSGRARTSTTAAAGTSSYSYSNRVSACLTTNQWRGCRVSGCLLGCDPDGGYFQTEHDCCDRPHHYQDHHRGWVNPNMPLIDQVQVAGCEWSFTMFKELNPNAIANEYYPIEDGSGTFAQLGTVTARCMVNEKSQECKGPLCDGMSLTMTGGMYATIAYSHEPGNIINTPPGDVCEDVAGNLFNPLNNLFNTNNLRLQGGSSRGPGYLFDCGIETRNGTEGRKPEESATRDLWYEGLSATACTTPIFRTAQSVFGPIFSPDSGNGNATRTPNRAAAAAPPKARAMYEDEGAAGYGYESNNLYGGVAIMFAGQTTLSSTKDGLKVEETGNMEYVPWFFTWKDGLTQQYNYPLITGGNIQMWFTEEEEQGEHTRR